MFYPDRFGLRHGFSVSNPGYKRLCVTSKTIPRTILRDVYLEKTIFRSGPAAGTVTRRYFRSKSPERIVRREKSRFTRSEEKRRKTPRPRTPTETVRRPFSGRSKFPLKLFARVSPAQRESAHNKTRTHTRQSRGASCDTATSLVVSPSVRAVRLASSNRKIGFATSSFYFAFPSRGRDERIKDTGKTRVFHARIAPS